jgi:HSP20 family molecular chaperone IbpA
VAGPFRAGADKGPNAARFAYEGGCEMARLSLFNSPLLLGFDRFEEALERVSKAPADGYPPYNVEQTGPDSLRITLAVAGFGEDDLTIQVEARQLVIRGRQAEDESGRVYLHRGIAARQFQRSFVLAEGVEVTAASLDNGLLHIELDQPRIEPNVRTVEIKPDARQAKGKRIDHD